MNITRKFQSQQVPRAASIGEQFDVHCLSVAVECHPYLSNRLSSTENILKVRLKTHKHKHKKTVYVCLDPVTTCHLVCLCLLQCMYLVSSSPSSSSSSSRTESPCNSCCYLCHSFFSPSSLSFHFLIVFSCVYWWINVECHRDRRWPSKYHLIFCISMHVTMIF